MSSGKRDIIQHRKMSHFAFKTASQPSKLVSFPTDLQFLVEDCGSYRKICFKGTHSQTRKVMIGSDTVPVHFVDVRESVKHILKAKKWPYSPIAWWTTDWVPVAPPSVFTRYMEALGKRYAVVVTVPSGVDKEIVQSAVEGHLAGVAFDRWSSTPVVNVIIRVDDQNYTIGTTVDVL